MSNARAFWATAKRELLIRCRYPDWLVAMLLWPILMPTFTVFATQALAGPDNSGGEIFAEIAGTSDYIGFVFIGIVMWSWLNTVLWQVGATLRTEQRRGTLESNWGDPRFALGNHVWIRPYQHDLLTHDRCRQLNILQAGVAYESHVQPSFGPRFPALYSCDLRPWSHIRQPGSTRTRTQLCGKLRTRHVHGLLRDNLPISVMPHWMADRRERPTAHLLHSSHPRDWACRCRLQRCIRLILDSLRLCGISHSRRVYALHF